MILEEAESMIDLLNSGKLLVCKDSQCRVAIR